MSENYYERTAQEVTVDGRQVNHWKQPIDQAAEDALIAILNSVLPQLGYKAKANKEDHFAALDFRIDKLTGDLVVMGELKRRPHLKDRYVMVPLNFRKTDAFKNWLDKGTEGLYFVMWADVIGFVEVSKALQAGLGYIGTKERVKSDTDTHDPCYMVPVHWFNVLCSTPKLPLASVTTQSISPR